MPKRNIVIVCIVVVILLAVVIVINKKEKGNEDGNPNSIDKTLNMYKKIEEATDFTFSMEELDNEIEYKVLMAQKDKDFCIDMDYNGEHRTTLILQNRAYFITHDSKEYVEFEDESEIEDADILIYALSEIVQNSYISGKEKIDGKTYEYEEFDNDGTGFINFLERNETSKIKTRFYFEGDDIKYIKNIMTDEDGVTEETLKANLSLNIDENLFKFPDNYKKTEE